ncbi:hypothetical protein GJV06_05440 [Enterobacteriaceae bacterium RIT691]|nr:hypothetical protein [Enterobacteriaceae bacterium RIT691]
MLPMEREDDVVLRVKGMEKMLEGIVRELKVNKGVVDEFIRDDIANFRHCSKDIINHHVSSARTARRELENVTIRTQKKVRTAAQSNWIYGMTFGMVISLIFQMM